jgi:hypothetical protein
MSVQEEAPLPEPEVFHRLFTAKWNVPRATVALGLASTEQNWADVKERFRAYCNERPIGP